MGIKTIIFNIQKYSIYDGPGVRTLIFFKGCPLRCKWCSNPEGFECKYQVMLKNNLCTNCGACVNVCPVGIHSISKKTLKHEIKLNSNCTGCRKCINVCNAFALSITGNIKTTDELLRIIEEDKVFYDLSGGGVTLGGGEALFQFDAAKHLLMLCKEKGINTAIETSGYASTKKIFEIARFIDLFLYDIKHINPDDASQGERSEGEYSEIGADFSRA